MDYSFLIILLVFAGLMFYTTRQQKKQAQKRQDELAKLTKGTEVVTIGGMYAVVDEVDTDAGTVVLDVDGVYLTFELIAIKRIITPTASDVTPITTDMETSAVDEG